MSKNALYNLIRMNYKNTTFALPLGIHLADDTNATGARYFRFELPLTQRTRIDDLILREHHVSVYELPKGKIDAKSQYHYTAYFMHASGADYQLHVYFDNQDGLVVSPKLSVLKEGGICESVNSDDLNEVFADLAIKSCSNLITFLRDTQKSRVNALELAFKALESRLEALSSDLVKNKKEYLAIITDQIHTLEELSKISNKLPDIVKQIRWLTTSKEIIEAGKSHLEATPVLPPPTMAPERVNEGETSNRSKEDSPKKVEKKSRKTDKKKLVYKEPQSVKPKPAISADIADLKSEFKASESMHEQELAPILMDLYSRLKEKEWQLEFKERTATVDDLNEMRVLNSKIEAAGIKTLQRLLLQSYFKSAESLYAFYHLLPGSYLSLALGGNRHLLLDFLLKHKIVPVHLNNVTANDIVASSLVDYFFKTTGFNEPRVACLDVLIKHGASLMGIDSKSGLPYAALLLSQKNHPLRAALERNPGLTLNNIEFYSKMNQVLRSLGPSSVTSDVGELIKANKEAINSLRQRVALYQEPDNRLELSLGQELAHQIQTDPEISYQRVKIRKKAALLLKRVTLAEKKKISPITELVLDLLAKKIKGIENPEFIPPFEDIKRETIKLQLLTEEYINLYNESCDISDILSSINPFSHKIKNSGAMRLRHKEIIDRIVEIRIILTDAYIELLEETQNSSLANQQQLTTSLVAGVSTDSKSDETETVNATTNTALSHSLSSTFFAPNKNAAADALDTNNAENPSNENEVNKQVNANEVNRNGQFYG